MRRALLTLTTMLVFIAAWSQNDEMTRQQADKLDSLTIKLMNQERYEDAIKAKERELTILKALYGEKDSTYINELAFSAKLYYRNRQPREAANTIEKAAQLYAEHISNNNDKYAFYLDNLSLYQISINEYDKARENCRKALTIYEKLGRNDYDLAIILMHMAESSYYSGQEREALTFELRSLSILKSVCGQHSDEYIGELPFLQKYYQAVGDEKNAKRIEESIERLRKEKEDGIVDLPEPVKFENVETCRAHNADALRCISYYLTHKVSAPQMNQAAQYIFSWVVASGDVSVVVDEEIGTLGTSVESMPYHIAYLAAYSYICLTENIKELDERHFMSAIDILLQFYVPNKELTGKVELLENYLQLQKEGKLEEELSRLWHKLFKGNGEDSK